MGAVLAPRARPGHLKAPGASAFRAERDIPGCTWTGPWARSSTGWTPTWRRRPGPSERAGGSCSARSRCPIRPGLVAGSVRTFSRSIAEFGATIIVVSAILRTAPIRIFTKAEAGSLELASAYSVVLMLVPYVLHFLMSRWLLKVGHEPVPF